MATTVANKNVKVSSDEAKEDDPIKKLELGLLEEDDEFEEFPVEGSLFNIFYCISQNWVVLRQFSANKYVLFYSLCVIFRMDW